jgi:hypothetical protein
MVGGVGASMLRGRSLQVVFTKEGSMSPEEVVNHPKHYTWLKGIEVIDITEQLNFNLGNVLKYVLRCDHKHTDSGITDLKKAAFYLQREIARRERGA